MTSEQFRSRPKATTKLRAALRAEFICSPNSVLVSNGNEWARAWPGRVDKLPMTCGHIWESPVEAITEIQHAVFGQYICYTYYIVIYYTTLYDVKSGTGRYLCLVKSHKLSPSRCLPAIHGHLFGNVWCNYWYLLEQRCCIKHVLASAVFDQQFPKLLCVLRLPTFEEDPPCLCLGCLAIYCNLETSQAASTSSPHLVQKEAPPQTPNKQ